MCDVHIYNGLLINRWHFISRRADGKAEMQLLRKKRKEGKGAAPARGFFTPLFHKTSRAGLIFLRRAMSFRRLRISTGMPPPEFLAQHKNLRRNHFPLL